MNHQPGIGRGGFYGNEDCHSCCMSYAGQQSARASEPACRNASEIAVASKATPASGNANTVEGEQWLHLYVHVYTDLAQGMPTH